MTHPITAPVSAGNKKGDLFWQVAFFNGTDAEINQAS